MQIKRLGQTIAILAGAVTSAHLPGCGSDCEDSLDCEPYAPFTPIDGGSGEGGADGGSAGSGSGGSSGSASGGDTGAGGMAGAAGSGNECDLTQSPGDDACVISDDYGVFVSPNGSDADGDGTMSQPYRTLGKAIAEATTPSGQRLVFACSTGEDYAEALTLTSTHSQLRMYGGFSCDDWTYNTATRANMVSPTPIAFRATNLSRLHVENFNIVAADATSPGTSSFGMFVVSSQSVTLRRVNLSAGKGANGAIGGNGTTGADGAMVAVEQAGKGALCDGSTTPIDGGKGSGASSCGSLGGDGGDGQFNIVATANGLAGQPASNLVDDPPGSGIAGVGASDAGKAGGVGGDGSNGIAGTDGAAAAPVGPFSSNGYATANGKDGTDGFPGQGGGGGGASLGSAKCVGASGGAGGMGGCGGTKGLAGGGGGASVALLSWSSAVVLDECILTSVAGGNGGKGGNGAFGGLGRDGASGGDADPSGIGAGGDGGDGGNGGNAGSGSGGTGGPSFAIAYKGTAPDSGTSTLTAGSGGGAGSGGELTTIAPEGLDGMSDDIYAIP